MKKFNAKNFFQTDKTDGRTDRQAQIKQLFHIMHPGEDPHASRSNTFQRDQNLYGFPFGSHNLRGPSPSTFKNLLPRFCRTCQTKSINTIVNYFNLKMKKFNNQKKGLHPPGWLPEMYIQHLQFSSSSRSHQDESIDT